MQWLAPCRLPMQEGTQRELEELEEEAGSPRRRVQTTTWVRSKGKDNPRDRDPREGEDTKGR
jgi:hypothetical protein